MADVLLREVVRALVAANPTTLGHVDPQRVLLVAGAARRESRASIRPLTFGGAPPRREQGGWLKPAITVRGVAPLYEICLRPRFFLEATPEARLLTLAHELWHIDPAFDGTLAEDRRHEVCSPARIEREVRAMVAALAPRQRLEETVLAHRGELRLSAWLARPPSRIPAGLTTRVDYDERDLYSAILEQT